MIWLLRSNGWWTAHHRRNTRIRNVTESKFTLWSSGTCSKSWEEQTKSWQYTKSLNLEMRLSYPLKSEIITISKWQQVLSKSILRRFLYALCCMISIYLYEGCPIKLFGQVLTDTPDTLSRRPWLTFLFSVQWPKTIGAMQCLIFSD